MNITEMTMYWMTRLDGLRDVCKIVGVVVFTASVLGAFFVTMIAGSEEPYDTSGIGGGDERYFKAMAKWHQRWDGWLRMRTVWLIVGCTVGLVAMIVHALLPTCREMAAIVVVPRIANSKAVQDIGSSVVDVAKEWIDELRKEKAGK